MSRHDAKGAGMETSRLELSAAEAAFSIDFSREAEAAAAGSAGEAPRWGSAVIGQPRALEALRMGVRIRAKGYNVYVSGAPGTGRRTAVLRVLEDEPAAPEKLRDIAYVYDFDAPLAPRVLLFPAGEGREFKRDLHRFVESLKRIVALQSESEANKRAEAEATAALEAEENRRLAELEAVLSADGFRAVQVETEGGATMDIVPLLRNGKPAGAGSAGADPAVGETAAPAAPRPAEAAIAAAAAAGTAGKEGAGPTEAGSSEESLPDESGLEPSSFEALQDLVAAGDLPEAEYNRLRELWYGHMDRMKRLFADLKKGRMELEAKIAAERDELLKPQVAAETTILLERWKEPKVHAWIEGLKADVEERLYLFRAPDEPVEGKRRRSPALIRYGVNLVVDRSGAPKAPVVVENHPSAANLFGFVEPRPDEDGDTRGAYLRIRAGSFLQASGGYLVLRAEDVVADEEAWVRLKRVLQDGHVEIQPREGPMGGAAWLKPEAVKADVKVVMIGGESTYDILYQADPDFQKLFKVHAEFDSTMPRSAEALRDYASFVRVIVEEEGLLPVSAEGLAAVAEEGIRLAEYRTRLSTRFGLVADLLREADYRARLEGKSAIDAASVGGAVAARARLSGLPEEKIGDMIASGEIILQAQGTAVGRVNGLAVLDRGYYAFGLPAVISAQVSPGEGGVINIEGESGLSGEIYDKAVLIVEGFLRSRYARDFPLAVTASICFEQSYTAVEGDSASSTAVYALLSAIAALPLRQDIAVTGSMNQIGQVQPVGGVNEKIVGFYRICQKVGFTGTQGVMIPRRNVVNLTLPRELQEAIAAGKFHIWAVSTIDEGLGVLSGLEAGKMNERGEFPADSFNARVRKELQRMAKTIKNYLG
ncbi:MAG: AAA family ATPase [Spirochaetaceae bacterium]|nr:AAA family ATPase [Spirochaetaceae bacterium]